MKTFNDKTKMKKMNKTINKQITSQIEGKTLVKVKFLNEKKVQSELLSLYAQADESFFIEPTFCSSKKINKSGYKELCSQFTGEQEFNTDPEIIRSELSYDEFFNKYYN